MTSYMYTEDFTQLKSRKLNALLRALAIVVGSFLLGYIVFGMQLTNPYTVKDVSLNVSEDWHGNVMRSNWGR